MFVGPILNLSIRQMILRTRRVARFALVWLFFSLSLLPAHAGTSLGSGFAGLVDPVFIAMLPESGRVAQAEHEHDTESEGPDEPPLWLDAASTRQSHGGSLIAVAAGRALPPTSPEFFKPHLRAPPVA